MNTGIRRSSFVTVVAWFFIIISGFGALIAILQNILMQTVFNTPQFERAIHSMPPKAPPFAGFMFGHFRLLFLAFLIFSLISLVASIGLLKRKNWARQIFIALMVLGILWSLISIGLQLFVFSYMHTQTTSASGMTNLPDIHVFMIAIMVFSLLIAIGFSTLFGWIIKKLLSPAILAEFRH